MDLILAVEGSTIPSGGQPQWQFKPMLSTELPASEIRGIGLLPLVQPFFVPRAEYTTRRIRATTDDVKVSMKRDWSQLLGHRWWN